MTLEKIDETIKCDTVLCNNLSKYKIETNSFKGYTFLCENCFRELQNLLKKKDRNNEEKN